MVELSKSPRAVNANDYGGGPSVGACGSDSEQGFDLIVDEQLTHHDGRGVQKARLDAPE